MPSAARSLALRVLRDLEQGPDTLADRLAGEDIARLDPRERGFLHELVLGTLRQRGPIDHALQTLLDRPMARVDGDLLGVLRLAAHQILHLRVPARAAVAEAVDLARQAQPRGAGFVNAVLRRLVREGAPPCPDPASDPLGWLRSAGSLPEWLARRWLARLGPEAAIARARAALVLPAATFRLNPRRPGAFERAQQAGLEPEALDLPGAYVARAGRPADLHAEGVLYLQHEPAQVIAHLAAGRGKTLDACAAPGGKTTLMADLHRDAGDRVVAAEASRRRRETLGRLVARWGSPNVDVVGADGLRPPFRADCFAQVLLDAPCSGLGTLAHHPDLRWRVREADLPRHAARQSRLLRATAPLVRGGGRLVYSTCSTEPEENQAVVDAFVAETGFRLETLPAWAVALGTAGPGFFAAVLRRP